MTIKYIGNYHNPAINTTQECHTSHNTISSIYHIEESTKFKPFSGAFQNLWMSQSLLVFKLGVLKPNPLRWSRS